MEDNFLRILYFFFGFHIPHIPHIPHIFPIFLISHFSPLLFFPTFFILDSSPHSLYYSFCVFIFQAPQSRERLRCYYKTDHPLCTIKRCPIEVVFTNPDIMILHQIMASAEIDRVIKIAEPLVRKLLCPLLYILFSRSGF